MNSDLLEKHRAAILELKGILDHVYCFFNGATNLPLSKETRVLMNSFSSSPNSSISSDHLYNTASIESQSNSTLGDKFINLHSNVQQTTNFNRDLKSSLHQSSGDADQSKKILLLERKVSEQQKDIDDLEEELREAQTQISMLKEEIKVKKFAKYVEASELAGFKRTTSVYNKSKKTSRKMDSIRKDSIFLNRFSKYELQAGTNRNIDSLYLPEENLDSSPNNSDSLSLSNLQAKEDFPSIQDSARLPQETAPSGRAIDIPSSMEFELVDSAERLSFSPKGSNLNQHYTDSYQASQLTNSQKSQQFNPSTFKFDPSTSSSFKVLSSNKYTSNAEPVVSPLSTSSGSTKFMNPNSIPDYKPHKSTNVSKFNFSKFKMGNKNTN
ncbi:hypothetical protein AYI69_g2293 [Smittium culicis]|uniref:Uncharacterized protein n=1 Tax=Smittium culicis TaxID=133412 RepID=A0A1R1YN14_9FUNG|nr:hypothetical protein AYI69_g2293 [Smittium culicis]